ncbi:TetR/AcrR family transcriptional regulator [soil metagenome]
MTTETSSRARPMGLEERQDMIIGVVIPLILEHGRDLTSKQIAEACGIAEGTIFRAFGDKDTLITKAVERYLDPLALRTSLRSIDPDLPLDDKLRAILGLLRDRFSGVIRMMAALGRTDPPPRREERHDFAVIIGELLAPHAAELRMDPERVAHFARVIAFTTALPVFGDTVPFTPDELLDLFMHGVKNSKES